jgi:hypothetical protein
LLCFASYGGGCGPPRIALPSSAAAVETGFEM